MSEKRSPWQDPNVEAALKDGRQPSDIALLQCPACGNFAYYNQGSHFSCGVNGCEWSASGQGLDHMLDMDGVTWLSDYDDVVIDMDDVP